MQITDSKSGNVFISQWAAIFCFWLINDEVSQSILSVLEDGKKIDNQLSVWFFVVVVCLLFLSSAFLWQPGVSVSISISFESRTWKQNRGLSPCRVSLEVHEAGKASLVPRFPQPGSFCLIVLSYVACILKVMPQSNMAFHRVHSQCSQQKGGRGQKAKGTHKLPLKGDSKQ